MKKTIQNIVLATLCLFLSKPAMTQTTALKVGDKVPDITIDNVFNYKTNSLKLSDFKGKLLILDFWATWCGSCIRKFPLLDSMQNAYRDKLQVLLVSSSSSGDTKQKVAAFFEKRKNVVGYRFNLPTVVGDYKLKTIFPHSAIPYYVWIGPGNKLINVTSSAGLTAENIVAVLQSEGLLDKHKAGK